MDLFLIAHKVCNEPAFDIAHRLPIGEEEGWIVTTSGHRAYPYAYWKLEDLADVSDYPHQRPLEAGNAVFDSGNAFDLPDHYQTVAEKGRGSGTNGRDLLERIGLVSAREPMTRRSF